MAKQEESRVGETFEYLYHYTDTAGLMGILQSGVLWATEYKSLNDTKELQLAKEALFPLILKNILSTLERDGQIHLLDKEAHGIIRKELDRIHEALLRCVEIFTVSFCAKKKCSENKSVEDYIEENGLLSQWRGYANGGGFMVKFDAPLLEKAFSQEVEFSDHFFSSFCDVAYYNSKTQHLTSPSQHFIDALLELSRSFAEDFMERDSVDRPPSEEVIWDYITMIFRIKDFGFWEEQEIRIVCNLLAKNLLIGKDNEIVPKLPARAIHFRTRNTKIIPYVHIFEKCEELLKQSIKAIVIGPAHDQKTQESNLKKFLDANGYKDVEIHLSNIPLLW